MIQRFRRQIIVVVSAIGMVAAIYAATDWAVAQYTRQQIGDYAYRRYGYEREINGRGIASPALQEVAITSQRVAEVACAVGMVGAIAGSVVIAGAIVLLKPAKPKSQIERLIEETILADIEGFQFWRQLQTPSSAPPLNHTPTDSVKQEP